MNTKVRKVGNSLVLTIPSSVAEEAGLYEGQEMTINSTNRGIEYIPTASRRKKKIDWDKYILNDGVSMTGGLSPDEFVSMLRQEWNERDKLINELLGINDAEE